MPWQVKRISNNRERAADSTRKALENACEDGKNNERGCKSAATAVESALQAFSNLNGHMIEIVASGDISAEGKGYLTISLQTIDQDVIV